jgi:3'-5' exoribonuclease
MTMTQYQRDTSSLPSKQPCLNMVYGLSRFSGFYFITGLKARVRSGNRRYWEVIIQDAFDSVVIYSDAIEPIIHQLHPFSPIQIECAKRRHRGRYYFLADMITTVKEVPLEYRLVSLIPYSCVIIGANLSRLIDKINTITFPPLQRFIHCVIMQSNIMLPLVRNPASLRYHHNQVGGLLSHSLAVADLISKEFRQGTMEYDIAITAALFHDLGKTQTLNDNLSRTAIGSLTDHDALTLELCAEPLAQLSQNHPHVANQLRHAWTCASPNARYGFTAKTRVAKQLQIADNFNAC